MNLDFTLLVQSGLLVMMAIGAAALGRIQPAKPWVWFALYALTQVLRAWLDLVTADIGETPWLLIAGFAVTTAAIALLLEFSGRGSGVFAARPRSRPGAHLLLLASIGLIGWQFGRTGLDWAFCFGGTLAGLGATLVLLRFARIERSRGSGLRLRLVAWLLPAAVFADSFAHSPLVLAEFAIPAGTGRGVAAIVVTLLSLAVYLHNAMEQQRRLPRAATAGWRQRRYACFAAVWAVVIAGWFIARFTAERQDVLMREQILARTQLAAAAVDPAAVSDLQWSEADLTRPSYRGLKSLMRALRHANADVRFALLAGLNRAHAYFLADSEPPDSPDYSPPGQRYDEAGADYLAGMARGRPFVLGPFDDRWGTWVVGSVRLARLDDGRTVNLELDVAAADWAMQIRRARLPIVLITLLISVLILGFFQAQERLRDSALLTSLSEQRMRAAKDAAQAATRAKSEFLAVMSHELRTPLAGVIGMLDLLRRAPPDATRRQYTAVARDSAGTLLRLLDDILDMAKIEAGRLTLESIHFRPRDVFRHLCEGARLRAVTKGIGFSSAIRPGVPEVLIGDPTRLRQVLGNLQNNALKFTDHGEVSVEIDSRPIDDATVLLLVSVRDTGCGIGEEHRARLFAKFEQADLSTTRRYGGTGLGLSIVKALAEAMHGSVTVESKVGQGSTFTFAAPFARGIPQNAPPPDDDAPVELPAPSVRLRILCAEDDAVNRLVAEALITHLGHQVEFAENGRQAVDRLRTERFDLVLMDGRMPVMDGFQATRSIRCGTAGVLDRDIYICAATANVSEADKLECQVAGMNDYVKKPLADRELFEAFARAVTWLAAHGRTPVLSAASAPSPSRPPGLSEAELLASLDLDSPDEPSRTAATVGLPSEIRDRLQSLFWTQAPGQVRALRLALDRRDAGQVRDLAHTLKSSAGYIGAPDLSGHFADLDRLATAGALDAGHAVLAAAEAEFARLRPAVAPFAETCHPPS